MGKGMFLFFSFFKSPDLGIFRFPVFPVFLTKKIIESGTNASVRLALSQACYFRLLPPQIVGWYAKGDCVDEVLYLGGYTIEHAPEQDRGRQ